MPNLGERFRAAHRIWVPDLWGEIERRDRQPGSPLPNQRRSAAWVAGVVLSVLLAAGAFSAGILALAGALRGSTARGPTSNQDQPAKPGAVTKIPLKSRLGPPQDIWVGEGAAWALVGTGEDNEVYRIDDVTSAVKELPETKGAQWVAAGEGAVWVTACPNGESACGRGLLLRLDPGSGRVMARIVVGDFPTQVVVGEGAVWVQVHPHVVKIDPSTNSVVDRFNMCCGLWGVAGRSLWMTEEGYVFRVDTRTGKVLAKIRAPKGDPCMVAVSEEAVWVASCLSPFKPNDVLAKLDPATNRIVWTSPISASAASRISTGAGFLWIAEAWDEDPGITVRRLDPATDRFVGEPVTIRYGPGRHQGAIGLLAGPPLFMAVGDRAVWINDFAEGAVIRIDLR